MNHVLLMMGGSGTRFGAKIPKQFILVEKVPIFAYILSGYQKCDFVDTITVVSHSDWKDYVKEWAEKLHINKLSVITEGGSTRSESVLNGLNALQPFAKNDDVVLIHDATHPYVDEDGTYEVIEGVKKYGGATLGQRQYDTVYQMDSDTHMLKQVIPRTEIVSGASPEAFTFGSIYKIYTESTKEELEQMTSAGAIALHHGIEMLVVPANVLNLKITYKNDMEVFKRMVHEYFPDFSGELNE